MHRRTGIALLALIPALTLFIAGCGNSGTDVEPPKRPPRDLTKKPPEAAQMKELAGAKGWGKLSGKFTLEGMPPTIDLVGKISEKPDCKEHAAESAKDSQKWKVGPGGGLEGVVIYLKAPSDTYFPTKLDKDKKVEGLPGEVIVDQPQCAFVPRIQVHSPEYFDSDSKSKKKTGQIFKVKNTARFSHNFNLVGDPLYNTGGNDQMRNGTEKIYTLSPQPKALTFSCNIHTTMNGLVWVFDHPYAAVTKADGTFEIPFVPAGVPITVVVWHEGLLELNQQGFSGTTGKSFTFEDNKTTPLNLKLTAP